LSLRLAKIGRLLCIGLFPGLCWLRLPPPPPVAWAIALRVVSSTPPTGSPRTVAELESPKAAGVRPDAPVARITATSVPASEPVTVPVPGSLEFDSQTPAIEPLESAVSEPLANGRGNGAGLKSMKAGGVASPKNAFNDSS
jgi:hypothetical protein